MTTKDIEKVTPAEAMRLINLGAVLVDVRGRDEHARERIDQAVCHPLGETPKLRGPVVFHCKSGMRTGANAAMLRDRVDGPCFLIDGGLDAWRAAGLPVSTDRKAPLPNQRQVMMTAGALILTGAGIGLIAPTVGLGITAFVGAGLFVAGATGFCGMANLLALMPWNAALRPR